MAGITAAPGGPISGVPNIGQLSQYVVNRDGWEGVRWTLYDYQALAATGVTQLTFFALPLGQGTGLGGAAKTLTDTDMNLAGQLPANQNFLIESIEVVHQTTVPGVAAANPSAFGAQAVAAQVNDAYIFRRTGNLTLVIGSKSYAQGAPMMTFPPKADFFIDAALSDITTAGASMQSRIAFASSRGRPYMLKPASLLLDSNQNFSVTLSWPEGAQTYANAGRVGVILDGYLYRRSQ